MKKKSSLLYSLVVLVGVLFSCLMYMLSVRQVSYQLEIPLHTSVFISEREKFMLYYPIGIKAENVFVSKYLLSDRWRMYADEKHTGEAVIAFPIYRIDQGSVATGKTYPLFYTVEVRVGTSKDTKGCYDTDTGFESQKVTDVSINGTVFKKFSFSDAGMMKYVEGESYRTIHDGNCIVLEQIRTGSNYHDNTMKEGKTQAELNAYYDQAKAVIMSFQVTK